MGQEEIPRGTVYVRHGRMPQVVKRVEAIETRPHLPLPEDDLHPALGNALAGLVAEETICDLESLAGLELVTPIPRELRGQGIGEKHVG